MPAHFFSFYSSSQRSIFNNELKDCGLFKNNFAMTANHCQTVQNVFRHAGDPGSVTGLGKMPGRAWLFHSNVLPGRNLWTERASRLQSPKVIKSRRQLSKRQQQLFEMNHFILI